MKYGLPRDEKPKKKWKTTVENELRCLKTEVCFLRNQLDEATNKLAELSSHRQSTPFSFKQGCSRNKNPFSQAVQTKKITRGGVDYFKPIPLTQDCNVNSNQRILTGSLESPQGNPFAPIERPSYQSTWDYDTVTNKAVRIHSITCMPSYKDAKSFEELRYEDYVLKGIGFSNKVQRFFKLRSSTAERNHFFFTSTDWKPIEKKNSEWPMSHSTSNNCCCWTPKPPGGGLVPFGPSAENNKTSNRSFGPSAESNRTSKWPFVPSTEINRTSWPFGPAAESNKSSSWPASSSEDIKTPNWPFGPFAEGDKSSNWPLSSAESTKKPGWPFGLCSERNKTSSCPASNFVASSESHPEAEKPKSNLFLPTQQKTGTPNNRADDQVSQDGDSSRQVLLELKKMSEHILTINDQLSKMDSNLSDVSSRVSVMDSRLSAVYMFVTMQRFDKKWQGLETRLADIESHSSAKPVTQPSNEHTSEVLTGPLNELKESINLLLKDKIQLEEKVQLKEKLDKPCCFDNKESDELQMEESGKSSITMLTTSIKNETDSSSSVDISDLNLSDFVRSISCTDITTGSILYNSGQSEDNTVPNTPSKIKHVASIEMADFKSFSTLPLELALVENSGIHEKESTISNLGSVCSFSAKIVSNEDKEKSLSKTIGDRKKTANSGNICTEIVGAPEASRQVHEPELKINAFDNDNNNSVISKDPLGATVEQIPSSAKMDDLFITQTENDADDEFVIVEKSDVEESLEENSNSKTNQPSSSSEFRMYTDITEYLEINLGKKKNLVYEFGFEAKPDNTFECEGTPDREKKLDKTHQDTATTGSGEDSFQNFETNFIENNFADAKQSSPFVFYSPKSQEKPPGKLPFDKTSK